MSYLAISLILRSTATLSSVRSRPACICRHGSQLASKLDAGRVLLAVRLSFCFVLAWLASAIGLAPIIGAFAAGLLLEDLHWQTFVDRRFDRRVA